MTRCDNTRDPYDNPSLGAGAMDEQTDNDREVTFMRELSFEVKNLGVVKSGRFTQKPLTVFCGPNNSGKTWAMYSLYYWHRLLASLAKDKDTEPPDLSAFNKLVSKRLPATFNIDAELLENAQFHLKDVPAGTFRRLLEEAKKKNTFLIPAERNGLHLFYRELSTRRTALLHHASREKIDLNELLRDVIRSRYATPIADYINWLNQLSEIQRRAAYDFHWFAEKMKKELVRGAYWVDKSTGDITFKPYQIRRDGKATRPMGLHVTSSTVKSLFGLWFYLECQARPGDLLMIDEPELNIHPENQLKMARLFARLVNAGLNIVISTHSDYIVREFNSLIMLNEDKQGDLKKEHGYAAEEVLRPDQVGAYLFDQQTIAPFEITPDDGIYATTFDRVIGELNRVNDGIYYELQDRRMGDDD